MFKRVSVVFFYKNNLLIQIHIFVSVAALYMTCSVIFLTSDKGDRRPALVLLVSLFQCVCTNRLTHTVNRNGGHFFEVVLTGDAPSVMTGTNCN